MLALDINVLVRYLAQDDAAQAAAATRLIEQTLSAPDRDFVSLVSLLETVSVIKSRYGASAALVADILAALLDAASHEVQGAAAVRAALQRYCNGSVDLHELPDREPGQTAQGPCRDLRCQGRQVARHGVAALTVRLQRSRARSDRARFNASSRRRISSSAVAGA